MIRGFIGYLYRDNTLVMDKSDIKNTKDEEFRPVNIFIKVVLPLPLGPSIPNTLPSWTFKLKLSKALLLK